MTKLSADQKRFHEATKNDNIAILRDIINKFVNTKDEEGKTPLQNAESEEKTCSTCHQFISPE